MKVQIDVDEFMRLRDVEKRSYKFIADWFGVRFDQLHYWRRLTKTKSILKSAPRKSFIQSRWKKKTKIRKVEEAYNGEISEILATLRQTKTYREISQETGLSNREIYRLLPPYCKQSLIKIISPEAKQKKANGGTRGRKTQKEKKIGFYKSFSFGKQHAP